MSSTDIDVSDVIKPNVTLERIAGGAEQVLAFVQAALLRVGNPPAIVERYTEQAKAGNYEHLLRVSTRYCGEIDTICAYTFDTMGRKWPAVEYIKWLYGELPEGETRESRHQKALDSMREGIEHDNRERLKALAKWALVEPTHLYSRAEVLARPSLVPKSPGVYAWWFQSTGELEGIPDVSVPVGECQEYEGKHLLYIGIAPRQPSASKSSATTIGHRLRNHYRGNAEGSTLRLTLGCLLGMELRRVGNGKRMTFCKCEYELNDWMQKNTFVDWIVQEKPWELETYLLSQLSLPLNLDQNNQHPFHAHLSRLRREAKAKAKQLPIKDTKI